MRPITIRVGAFLGDRITLETPTAEAVLFWIVARIMDLEERPVTGTDTVRPPAAMVARPARVETTRPSTLRAAAGPVPTARTPTPAGQAGSAGDALDAVAEDARAVRREAVDALSLLVEIAAEDPCEAVARRTIDASPVRAFAHHRDLVRAGVAVDSRAEVRAGVAAIAAAKGKLARAPSVTPKP